MKAVYTELIGRFGNQIFQYAHARALAEQNGVPLHTQKWIGEQIFDIPVARRKEPDDFVDEGYHQTRKCYIFQPRLMVQRMCFSDIQQRECNNSACMMDASHEQMV